MNNPETNMPLPERRPWLSIAAVAVTATGMMLLPAIGMAQRGGAGAGGSKSAGYSTESKDEKQAEQEADKPRCPEIVGKHLLLERMTADFDLTCAQEDKIEPLLHDEESVSKPLLAYSALTPEEKQAMMLKVKLAARAQIRPLLTPDQQKKSDAEAEQVSEAGGKPKKGGKKNGTPKKVAIQDDAFKGEEDLCSALAAYTAFSVKERQQLILQVKQAARREGAPALAPDQAAKVDADIKVLQQQLS
jgi:hypothetical protein